MSPFLEPVDGAISLGVGPDVSWDLDVAGRGVKVAMFDPTVRRLPCKVPNGSFYRIGACGQSDANARFRPLNELVAMAGFSSSAELLLKMDVEGAEWSTLSSVKDGGLGWRTTSRLSLRCTSSHVWPTQSCPVKFSVRYRDSAASHVPVHVHANNYSRLIRFDDDWFPDAVEVSYVRRDLAASASLASQIRSSLDVASDQRVADIDLEGILELSPT